MLTADFWEKNGDIHSLGGTEQPNKGKNWQKSQVSSHVTLQAYIEKPMLKLSSSSH